MNLLVIFDELFLKFIDDELLKIYSSMKIKKIKKVIFINIYRELGIKERNKILRYFSEYEVRFYSVFNCGDENVNVFIGTYIFQNEKKYNIYLYDPNKKINLQGFLCLNKRENNVNLDIIGLSPDTTLKKMLSITKFNNVKNKIEFSRLISSVYKEKNNKIYVDISTLIHFDYATGIQRVVKEIASRLNDEKYEFVYSFEGHKNFYLVDRLDKDSVIGSDALLLEKSIVDFSDGDKLLFLDLHLTSANTKLSKIYQLQNIGVKCIFVVYDLLPIEFPSFFVNELSREFINWLHVVSSSNGAICISKDVESKLKNWIEGNVEAIYPNFKSYFFHLGADFKGEDISKDIPDIFSDLMELKGTQDNVFLMVGTIEPRKAHLEVIEAFEKNWAKGKDDILCIIGRNGWNNTEIVEKLTQENKNLFWFENVKDTELSWIYRHATCLIAASLGEGFGLPLIEAAHHGLPIIARNIPVFREVAGNGAYYFDDNELDMYITQWLLLKSEKMHPDVSKITYLNWSKSVNKLESILDGF